MTAVNIVLLAVLCFESESAVTGAGPAAEGGRQDVPVDQQIEEIARHVLASNSRIESLLIDCESTTSVKETTTVDRILAAYTKDSCFVDYVHGVNSKGEFWRDPGRFQLHIVNNSGVAYNCFTGSEHPADGERSHAYWTSPYFQAIGWHPGNQLFAEHPQRLFVDEFFSSGALSELKIVDSEAVVGGQPCICVATKSESDVFWFAPALGYSLVQRVFVRGNSERIRKTFVCTEFSEVSPKIWLPRRVECTVDSIRDAIEARSRSFTVKVSQIAVNEQIPAEVFHFTAPPGTLSTDSSQRPTSMIPGGESRLEFWGVWCLGMFPPTDSSYFSSGWLQFVSILPAIVVFTVGVPAFLIFQRRRFRPVAQNTTQSS